MSDLCRQCGQALTLQDRPGRPAARPTEEDRCARCGALLQPTRAVPAEPHGLGLSVGDVLEGKWRIASSLGSGGMGSVFLARDLGLDRDVAIKLLAPKFAADPGFAARFEREAQATAKLEHPNIVPVFAVGRHLGRPFLVMKALEGVTLSRLLRERMAEGQRLGREELLSLFGQLCGALAFLHGRGYVHRDVKPANIFVGSHGHVTLLDFGVLHDASAERLTLKGTQLGTPAYASPEQLRGASQIDPRADVYALGVVLYETLAQRLPYSGDPATPSALQGLPPPPLADQVPGLPAAVGEVVLRALAPRPEDRFGNAVDLFTALESAWADPGEEPVGGSVPVLVPTDARPTLPGEPPAVPSLDSAVRAAGLGPKVPVAALAGGAALLVLGLVGLGLWWTRPPPSAAQIPDPAERPHRPARSIHVPPPAVAPPSPPSPPGPDGGLPAEKVRRPEGEFTVPVF